MHCFICENQISIPSLCNIIESLLLQQVIQQHIFSSTNHTCHLPGSNRSWSFASDWAAAGPLRRELAGLQTWHLHAEHSIPGKASVRGVVPVHRTGGHAAPPDSAE